MVGLAHIPADIAFTFINQALIRADGKFSDGLRLAQWKEGCCATSSVTVIDIVAASYLNATSVYAIEAASKRKEDKYAKISFTNHFCHLAFETFGPINQVGSDFLNLPSHISDEPRLFFFNVFQFVFNASIIFGSPTHLGT